MHLFGTLPAILSGRVFFSVQKALTLFCTWNAAWCIAALPQETRQRYLVEVGDKKLWRLNEPFANHT